MKNPVSSDLAIIDAEIQRYKAPILLQSPILKDRPLQHFADLMGKTDRKTFMGLLEVRDAVNRYNI